MDSPIERIIQRPEFRDARWGMAFYAPDTGERLYSISPDGLFVPASAIKVFIAGTAFSALGPGHRFRTRVYRTGPVRDGVLHGDLVLVAGGDLLLGGRLRPDGTLALPDPDHTYGAAAVPGDPLAVFRGLADQVAAHGVRRVAGRVRVDASLFREATEDIANGGLAIQVSPMMLNDNVVDVMVRPGNAPGAPGVVEFSPRFGYVRILNDVRTIPAADAPTGRMLRYVNDTASSDGARTVTLTGDILVEEPSVFRPYYVPTPVQFGAIGFAAALRDKGVSAVSDPGEPDHSPRARLAEQVSPPVSEEVKVMLKVSSNVHTVMWPHVVGSIAGHDSENPVAAYEELRGRLLRRAGLDPNPPGSSEGRYTADYFVTFLAHLRKQPYFPEYRSALPILGRDGSLANIEVGSPAAGHVFAKTGTGVMKTDQASNATVHKALAGYLQLPSGRWLTFAQFMEGSRPSLEAGLELANLAGKAMGEIATAAYLSFS
jgi:D-alanyl-D-alanine carboxypeptidase/D-alanyl-D-alanine-endopeptidase (penicillin-binding protein 4)